MLRLYTNKSVKSEKSIFKKINTDLSDYSDASL